MKNQKIIQKSENGTTNKEIKTYTANDETPDCMRCEHVDGSFDCCGSCGPQHGWYGYIRTESEETKEE